MAANWFQSPSPVTQRVRAYFAPVNRAAQQPVAFDPSEQGALNLDAPPSPWLDLGWIQNFARQSSTRTASVQTGIPAATLEQVRQSLDAAVSFEFLSWTKLTMALATSSQNMNLLAPAEPAVRVLAGSSATQIQLAPSDTASITAGSMIAVDSDYSGQTGFVGSPVSGAYLRQPLSDVNYIRRITFNVGLVTAVNGGQLTLAAPLPSGAPAAGSGLQAISGFVDREGGSFYQEWSALFILPGTQGERIFFHYPRLQAIASAEEATVPLNPKHQGGPGRILLKARFQALPVTDAIDGERVLCYRSFLPAPRALI